MVQSRTSNGVWPAWYFSPTRAATGAPGEPDALWELTPQQRQIALLAAAGHTNKEIAARLFLSPRTVSTHLYQVFPKLGITSRAALRDALDEGYSDPATKDGGA